jgi:hypothetical protein
VVVQELGAAQSGDLTVTLKMEAVTAVAVGKG